ncbi:PAS domain S-box protein [Desulfobacter curvatus]|uniref:PAS domain S-box protein n=1 Tax=Desulfobacter curvatus TaxID=2290 RepID=UPI000368435D|nr:PAS domain S-box protein [Desulfobacter curvatus]
MLRGVELFFILFNNLAIFIALATVYGYLLRNFSKSVRFRRQISMGLSFGLFAVCCMFANIPVFEGVIVDQRNAIIALSGAFGGPVSAVVSAFLAGAFRIHLGGEGTLAGVIGVSLAAISGIVLNRFPGSFSSGRKAFTSSFFATLVILPGFLFVKDFHTGWTLMKAVALPYGMAIFFGILVVGLLLNREKNEIAFEVALQENQERLQKEIVRRKEVEEELLRSRERLGMALSGANEGIWDWYLQKDTVYFDDRYYTMAGYEPNEFPATFGEFEKRIHAEDIEQSKSAIDSYLAGKLPTFKVEFRFLRKDGTYMWILGKGKIVSRDDQGNPLRFVGLHVDITELKKTEESLHLSRFIFDHANIGIYRIASDGSILEANQKAAQILGYTPKELMALSMSDIDPRVAHENWTSNWRKLTAQGMRNLERTHIRKDGAMILVEVNSNIIEYRGRQYAVAFVHDITARKQMEESLRLTQFIFDNAPIGIWRMGANGEILDVNKEGCISLGYTQEELRQMMVFDFAPGFDPTNWAEGVAILEAVGARTVEAAHQRRNGEIFPIQVVEKMVRFEDRKIHVAFVQDITERKRMAGALENRILALTQPLGDVTDIAFEDLFNLTDIQQLQDLYAKAFGVAALITHPDGTPITQPSNFTDLCEKIIRKTKKGCKKCNYSDSIIGRHNPDGPNIMACLSAGLWNAGASISVGGRHIANWLIGQVRNETLNEKKIMAYAQEIGVDETDFRAAYLQVPIMSEAQFERAANVLFAVTQQLSLSAYQNVQQARFISQHKQDEEELRKLRNYLSNIINSMPSVIVAVDKEGRVNQWNRQAEQVTGLSFGEVQAQPLAKVFPRLADEMESIQTSIRERRVIKSPKVPHKVGQDVCYEDITIFPLVANGVEGAVIRVDNVTELVRMEEMMIQSEKMLSVGGLAAGMAHEINNPLAGMMQTAQVMAERLKVDANIPANEKAAKTAGITMASIEQFMTDRGIPRMVEAITSSGQRVSQIVNNMLSFARKEDASVSAHYLDKILDKTIELAATDYDLKKEYDFKRIEIIREYDDDLPAVPCQVSKIQQVVLNILTNGAQAMQDAGTPEPKFIVRTYVDKVRDMACIEIEDNGPGMDEEIRKHIFDPFFTTKPTGVGTGLGLSVSYFIITENHNGEMTIESSPGAGAKFIIRLPLYMQAFPPH